MVIAYKSDIGKKREKNEDSLYVKGNLLIIADGMGGYNGGEIASKMAVDILAENLSNAKGDFRQKISRAIEKSNKEIFENAKDSLIGMGTTVDVCILDKDVLHIGHVGDSRVYVLRNGKLEKITVDHSYVEMLLSKGEITDEEARDYPMKNMITRAVGAGEKIKIDYYVKNIEAQDKLLMCTDGLTNMMSEDEIACTLINSKTPDDAVNTLVKKANDNGGEDNVTVIVAYPLSEA